MVAGSLWKSHKSTKLNWDKVCQIKELGHLIPNQNHKVHRERSNSTSTNTSNKREREATQQAQATRERSKKHSSICRPSAPLTSCSRATVRISCIYLKLILTLNQQTCLSLIKLILPFSMASFLLKKNIELSFSLICPLVGVFLKTHWL